MIVEIIVIAVAIPLLFTAALIAYIAGGELYEWLADKPEKS